jgi:hypothetical protein
MTEFKEILISKIDEYINLNFNNKDKIALNVIKIFKINLEGK